MRTFFKNKQYYKFCLYGFLKNLRFFDAFFILFLLEKGISYTEIGFLYATREIISNIAEIPSGIVADTYGRKYALIFSFVLYIFSFIIFYLSAAFWLFLMAFVFYGMADAFRSGTHKGMIMDYLRIMNWEKQKIRYYGHTRSCSQRGSAIASLVAGSIVFYFGSYHTIFLYSIVPYLLNLILIVSYPAYLNKSGVNGLANNSNFKQTWHSLVSIIKQPKVWQLVNSAALYTGYQKAVKDYIQLVMIQVIVLIPILANVTVTQKEGALVGFFYFIIYLINAKASSLSGRIKFTDKYLIIYNTLLIGLLFGVVSGLFYIADLWLMSLLFFVGVYVIENIRKPVLTGFLADATPNEILTSVLSVQSLLRTVITVILSVSLGVLADFFGIGYAFLTISVMLVFSTILIGNKGKKRII